MRLPAMLFCLKIMQAIIAGYGAANLGSILRLLMGARTGSLLPFAPLLAIHFSLIAPQVLRTFSLFFCYTILLPFLI